jgi:hypothetical protein
LSHCKSAASHVFFFFFFLFFSFLNLVDVLTHFFFFRFSKRAPPAKIPETSKKRPSATEVENFRTKGNQLIEDASQQYANMRSNQADGDDKFMDQMLKAGTLADRVAAMTLRIQQSPMHELNTIDALLKLCGKGNHRGARLAMEALVDLFKGNLIPDDRVLLALEQRPISDPGIADEHVFIWTYEAGIKSRFSLLLEVIIMKYNYCSTTIERDFSRLPFSHAKINKKLNEPSLKNK